GEENGGAAPLALPEGALRFGEDFLGDLAADIALELLLVKVSLPQALRHLVKCRGELAEFVAVRDFDPVRKVSPADRGGTGDERAEWAGETPGDDDPRETGDEQSERQADRGRLEQPAADRGHRAGGSIHTQDADDAAGAVADRRR